MTAGPSAAWPVNIGDAARLTGVKVGTIYAATFGIGAALAGAAHGNRPDLLRAAERVLGLPKDPGIDSKSPFKDLKVGTQTSALVCWKKWIKASRPMP